MEITAIQQYGKLVHAMVRGLLIMAYDGLFFFAVFHSELPC